MPYQIVKGTGSRPWKIKRDGVTVGSSKTRTEAEKSVKARYANEKRTTPKRPAFKGIVGVRKKRAK